MFETFKGNIDSRKESIDCGKLPKTFQDAVAVTRQLGIQYLWIDSLCIIQDDPEDWERESMLMEDVFSSAYCTISARATEARGLLMDRPERQCVKLDSGKYAPIFICEHIDDFDRDVEESPLSYRGWVFQERILSRRTIYFTDRQVYWECGVCIRSEALTKMHKYAGCKLYYWILDDLLIVLQPANIVPFRPGIPRGNSKVRRGKPYSPIRVTL